MKYFISAGEHSGDMHGAVLVKAIRSRDPEARIYGMGGPLMAAEGADILYDPTAKGTIGFIEVLKNYRFFRKLLDDFQNIWKNDRPDLVIWVDFGGFNLALAEHAHQVGLPVLCIFSPSAWAYGIKRAVKMRSCVTKLAAVLPFEAVFYKKMGLDVVHVGHPLIDRVKPSCSRQVFRANLGIKEDQRLIALLPGSRRQEIEKLLPPLLDAVKIILENHSDTVFILPVAPSIDRSSIENMIKESGLTQVKITNGGSYDLMNAADFGIIKSGTVTLEAAILGLPMIIFYRVNHLSYKIYKWLRNEDQKNEKLRIGLPNLVAGEELVPELIQEQCNGVRIAEEVLRFLNRPELMRETKEALAEVKDKVGPAGVMERVAEIALALAKSSKE